MAKVVLCPTLMDCAGSDPHYSINVLYALLLDCLAVKVAVDERQRLLAHYGSAAGKHQAIREWLDHVVKKRGRTLFVGIPLARDPKDFREVCVEVCRAVVGESAVFCDDTQVYSGLTLDGVNLLDRDEAVDFIANRLGSGRSVRQEVLMGNQYNVGNISGSAVNFDSSLQNVSQVVTSSPALGEEVKREINACLAELAGAVKKLPPDQGEDAAAAVELAKDLAEKSASESPVKRVVKLTADNLVAVAKGIGTVLPIAEKLVSVVREAVGF